MTIGERKEILEHWSNIANHSKKMVANELGHDYFSVNTRNIRKRVNKESKLLELIIPVSNSITLNQQEYIFNFSEFEVDMYNTMAIDSIK